MKASTGIPGRYHRCTVHNVVRQHSLSHRDNINNREGNRERTLMGQKAGVARSLSEDYIGIYYYYVFFLLKNMCTELNRTLVVVTL